MLWLHKKLLWFHLLITFSWYLWILSVYFFHISVFRFLFIYFSLWILMKNCCTYDRLHDFFPLCALNLCIIVSYDILNQVLRIPSCYQQLMPKISIITLLGMQVRVLQITETEFPAIVLFFFCMLYSKKNANLTDLLENNALVECGKTCDSLFMKVMWNSALRYKWHLRGLFPSLLFS